MDEEAFGQVQFTNGMCAANDWDFARRWANGEGCWELGCGKKGNEDAVMYMEDARTKFTQLIGKDFRAAIRQTIPCICPSCDAQLAVTQQQVEMVKTQMQEFSCPNCGGVVPFTQPSLHEQLQAAINAESGMAPPEAARHCCVRAAAARANRAVAREPGPGLAGPSVVWLGGRGR